MDTLVDIEKNVDAETVSESALDMILASWKERTDAYQYCPNKKHQYTTLEEFGEKLLAAIRTQL